MYVGVGSFAASTAEGVIEEQFDTGDVATSLAQAGLGLGVSVGADTVFSSPDSVPNDFVEFAGYGMQGAAFSNLGRSIQSGQRLGRTVRVTTEGDSGNAQRGSRRSEAAQFSLDV